MEGARIARCAKKRLAAEDEDKDAQPVPALSVGQSKEPPVVTCDPKNGGEVDLEELLGDGAGALIVEAPSAAVGEHAPSQFSGSKVLDAAQIAQHLGRGGRFFAAPPRSTVERAVPSLGFYNGETELVTPPFFGCAVGLCFGSGVLEEEAVGHVLAAPGREVLLAKTGRPSKDFEDWPDEIVLGLAFVWQLMGWEAGKDFAKADSKNIKRSIVNAEPIRKSGNRLGKKIARKKAALICVLHRS